MVSGSAAAHHGLGHVAQLDHVVGRLRASAMGFEDRPHVVGHDPRACGRRMNAVALVEGLVARHALQQKRHERDVVLRRERRIDLVKRDDVVAAVVRRRFHAGEDHRDAARLRALDDLRRGCAAVPRPAGRAGRRCRRARRPGSRTSPSSAQSSRASPPADVSPETPALTTSIVEPRGVEPLLQQRRIRRRRWRGRGRRSGCRRARRCAGARRSAPRRGAGPARRAAAVAAAGAAVVATSSATASSAIVGATARSR